MEFSSIVNDSIHKKVCIDDIYRKCAENDVDFFYTLDQVRDEIHLKFQKGTIRIDYRINSNLFASRFDFFIPKIKMCVSSIYNFSFYTPTVICKGENDE